MTEKRVQQMIDAVFKERWFEAAHSRLDALEAQGGESALFFSVRAREIDIWQSEDGARIELTVHKSQEGA